VKWRLAALLHDAPEYVIGDMISPVKAAVGPGYGELDALCRRRSTCVSDCLPCCRKR
jgi:5'-deoxynucleotidase YfbR-like HD superfamily hydrolase